MEKYNNCNIYGSTGKCRQSIKIYRFTLPKNWDKFFFLKIQLPYDPQNRIIKWTQNHQKMVKAMWKYINHCSRYGHSRKYRSNPTEHYKFTLPRKWHQVFPYHPFLLNSFKGHVLEKRTIFYDHSNAGNRSVKSSFLSLLHWLRFS